MFRYILFDSSQYLWYCRQPEILHVPFASLFKGHAEETLQEIAPLLIDVTPEAEGVQTIIDQATRMGRQKPCVSMLEATLPLASLAEQLRAFHVVEMPGRRFMLMRWYDTRILPIWLDILTSEQRAYFTRHITMWKSIDRFGVEQTHDLPEQDPAMVPTVSTPFQLDKEQEGRLLTAAEPDALLYELRRVMRKTIDGVPREVLYRYVTTYWQMARQHGLTEKADQLLLIQLALYTSGCFVDDPYVAARLTRHASEHEQAFADWFANVPKSVWACGMPLWQRDADHHATAT